MSTYTHNVRRVARRPATHVPGLVSIRLAALGGAAFFVLFLVFASLTKGMPSVSDSARETFSYVSAHDGRLQLAAAVYALAMPCALLFVSGLFRSLREAEGGKAGLAVAALGGGVLAAASTVIGALVMGTAASRIADIGSAGARVWWTLFLMSLGGTLVGLLLLIGATAVVSMETLLFPRWFTGASIILALLSVVGAFTIGYATTGFQAVAGIAVILDSVWILVVSFFLWRDPELALPWGSSR